MGGGRTRFDGAAEMRVQRGCRSPHSRVRVTTRRPSLRRSRPACSLSVTEPERSIRVLAIGRYLGLGCRGARTRTFCRRDELDVACCKEVVESHREARSAEVISKGGHGRSKNVSATLGVVHKHHGGTPLSSSLPLPLPLLRVPGALGVNLLAHNCARGRFPFAFLGVAGGGWRLRTQGPSS